jgi:Protein of unknown function (DUF4031)
MTVYVYKLPHQNPLGGSYPPPWYGLTADTEQELHSLAEVIGQNRQFYRPPHPEGQQQLPSVGHYDLDQGQRDQAVAAGAEPISWHQHKKMQRHQ